MALLCVKCARQALIVDFIFLLLFLYILHFRIWLFCCLSRWCRNIWAELLSQISKAFFNYFGLLFWSIFFIALTFLIIIIGGFHNFWLAVIAIKVISISSWTGTIWHYGCLFFKSLASWLFSLLLIQEVKNLTFWTCVFILAFLIHCHSLIIISITFSIVIPVALLEIPCSLRRRSATQLIDEDMRFVIWFIQLGEDFDGTFFFFLFIIACIILFVWFLSINWLLLYAVTFFISKSCHLWIFPLFFPPIIWTNHLLFMLRITFLLTVSRLLPYLLINFNFLKIKLLLLLRDLYLLFVHFVLQMLDLRTIIRIHFLYFLQKRQCRLLLFLNHFWLF